MDPRPPDSTPSAPSSARSSLNFSGPAPPLRRLRTRSTRFPSDYRTGSRPGELRRRRRPNMYALVHKRADGNAPVTVHALVDLFRA